MHSGQKRVRRSVLFGMLLLILAAALLFGGCGKGAPEASVPAQPGAESGSAPPERAKEVILATTTSTYDSGLLDFLLPVFEQKTGYKVKPIAVGTGQALKMGEEGNADVLLVHAPTAERPLVEKGIVTNYRLVMHNDFILVGPPGDPAGIKQTKTAIEAMQRLAARRAIFVSRGDDSGTHKKEKELWQEAGVQPGGEWYVNAGAGMGQTLNIASERGGYTLTDRGTYLALKKNLRLEVALEGDPLLLNIYHVMQVNPEKFPNLDINAAGAQAFVEFMVSPEGQKLIGEFGKDKYGEPLFFPDAGKQEAELGAGAGK
ncbi:MAG: substrate-binding domain-containing protein [Clostridia bacterium]|nr:substrate-binding domain-containing protein [Clostridia bacterium]